MRDQPPKSNSRLALSVCNFVQTHADAVFSLLSFRAPSMSPHCPDAWYRAPAGIVKLFDVSIPGLRIGVKTA